MLGYIIAALFGYGAGRIASSAASTRPAEASRWSGTVGAVPLRVYRNGATWAWEASNGTGSEATVVGALRAAVRFIIESGYTQNDDGVELRRADGRVTALVARQAATSGWRFVIESVTPPMQAPTASSVGNDLDSRGAAAIAMFDRLGKYAES